MKWGLERPTAHNKLFHAQVSLAVVDKGTMSKIDHMERGPGLW
jgi:hypothetical protein